MRDDREKRRAADKQSTRVESFLISAHTKTCIDTRPQ